MEAVLYFSVSLGAPLVYTRTRYAMPVPYLCVFRFSETRYGRCSRGATWSRGGKEGAIYGTNAISGYTSASTRIREDAGMRRQRQWEKEDRRHPVTQWPTLTPVYWEQTRRRSG